MLMRFHRSCFLSGTFPRLQRAVVFLSVLFLAFQGHVVMAQDTGSDGYLHETSRKNASKISPYYFGPNAFAIPDIMYQVSPDLLVELTGNAYMGYRGDKTYDVSLRASIPLWTRRANLTLWLPVMEWYRNTPENMAASNIAPEKYGEAQRGHLTGDVYVSIDLQLLEEKRFCPGLTLRAALKTASGGGYDVARYYDSAGYFFDTAVSKRFRLFHPDIYLQAALSGGFLCWQTGTGRQNDAVMYGFLLGFEWKGLRVRETIGGYAGWESSSCVDKELAHDRPFSLKTDVRYGIKNWELIFRYQHGLADYPYNQFQLGLGYHFDILKKRENK